MPLLRAKERRAYLGRLHMKLTNSKVELVEACSDHFFSTPMTAVEERIIDTFITTVRKAVAAERRSAKSYGKPKKYHKKMDGIMKSAKSSMIKTDLASPVDIPPSPHLSSNTTFE